MVKGNCRSDLYIVDACKVAASVIGCDFRDSVRGDGSELGFLIERKAFVLSLIF